jgi:hypothetical protein
MQINRSRTFQTNFLVRRAANIPKCQIPCKMLERDLGFALQMGLNPLIKTWALDKTPFEAVRTTMLHPDVAHTHTNRK